MTEGFELVVVDDDPVLRDIMGEACAALGYPAALASGRDAALDLLRDHGTIRLALVDVVLGGGTTGFALADDMRALRPGLDVVLLSGMGAQARPPQGGTAEILGKPLPLDRLRALLRDRLGPAG